MPVTPPIILGLDPGTRYLGFAILQQEQLLEYGVHELQNGSRPYDLIGHARRNVLRLIARHRPTCIAIEEPYLFPTKRAALLSALVQEIHERAKEIGIEVIELSPEIVRSRLMGNPKATKYEVAQRLGDRFAQVRSLVPAKPKIPALWLTSRERYWLHMFDALSLAVSASGSCSPALTGSGGQQTDRPKRDMKSSELCSSELVGRSYFVLGLYDSRPRWRRTINAADSSAPGV